MEKLINKFIDLSKSVEYYYQLSLKDKIEQNEQMIVKIKEESEKERIYKIYLDIFGKNGITKIIMKTMIRAALRWLLRCA